MTEEINNLFNFLHISKNTMEDLLEDLRKELPLNASINDISNHKVLWLCLYKRELYLKKLKEILNNHNFKDLKMQVLNMSLRKETERQGNYILLLCGLIKGKSRIETNKTIKELIKFYGEKYNKDCL